MASFYEAEHLEIALEEIFSFSPLGIIRKATNITLPHYNSFETNRRYYSYLF